MPSATPSRGIRGLRDPHCNARPRYPGLPDAACNARPRYPGLTGCCSQRSPAIPGRTGCRLPRSPAIPGLTGCRSQRSPAASGAYGASIPGEAFGLSFTRDPPIHRRKTWRTSSPLTHTVRTPTPVTANRCHGTPCKRFKQFQRDPSKDLSRRLPPSVADVSAKQNLCTGS